MRNWAAMAVCVLGTFALVPETSHATRITVENHLGKPVTAYLGFTDMGCYSMSDFASFCTVTKGNPAICSFEVDDSQPIDFKKHCPTSFAISVEGLPWSCPNTLAEFTLSSNRKDTYDVSLVSGFNVGMSIQPEFGTPAGPVTSASGHQKSTGVFPLGCDLCAGSKKPPSGDHCPTPDNARCHAGTQFNPDPPCQLSQQIGANFTVNVLAPDDGGSSKPAEETSR